MYYVTETEQLEDPRLQIYTKLSETQLFHCREPHRGLFIAESPKVIERALNAGYKPVLCALHMGYAARDAGFRSG